MDRTATPKMRMATVERGFERSRLSEEVLASAYERLAAICSATGRSPPGAPQTAPRRRTAATGKEDLSMTKCQNKVPAIYGRVSSEQQAEAATIDSQVAALQERIANDGLTLETEMRFLDEGFSGATLVRPALERLRDVAATGAIDCLYVHSPDRLARKYAYQVLLLDELQRCGVEVIFLNHPLGQTPEEDLLLQVQGMVAEYERAKILERSRRGKLHAARQGSVNVLSGAPYGYRYVSCREGDGEARYEIVTRRGACHPTDVRVGWTRRPVNRRSVPPLAGAGHSFAEGQEFLGPNDGLGASQELGIPGNRDLRQDANWPQKAAFAGTKRPFRATATSTLRLRRARGSGDSDSRSGNRQRGPLRCRCGETGRESQTQPAVVSWHPIPASRVDRLLALRLRVLWKTRQPQSRERKAARLRVLPLHRNG